MTAIPELQIPYEELKHNVIEIIKSLGDSFQFKTVCNSIGRLAINKQLVKNPNSSNFQEFHFTLQRRDENRVREIIWDLITERVLTIGDYHNDSWPWLSLSEYGKIAIASSDPIPNDPTGYLNRIKRDISNIDEIIETYLAESIRTYNINQLLSSTITLGCASERALILLIEVYENTFNDDIAKSNFSRKIFGKFIKTQFDEFNKSVSPILHTLPYELKDNYTNTLTGVFQMIRYNRNDAGHPTGKSIDKEALFANLQVFIPYCKFIYDMIEYLKKNKH